MIDTNDVDWDSVKREVSNYKPQLNIDPGQKIYEKLAREELPKPPHKRVSSSYGLLGVSRFTFTECVDRVAKDLQDMMITRKADAFVVRGASGVVMGGALLYAAPTLACIVARKDGENSHTGEMLSVSGGNTLDVNRYVIVDDFSSSGTTVNNLMKDMGQAQCVGILFYNHAESYFCHKHESRWRQTDIKTIGYGD